MKGRETDFAQLDAFLQAVDDLSQTTRRASENFYDCPPVDTAVQGERQMRTLIDDAYNGLTKKPTHKEICGLGDSFVDDIKALYWESVSSVKEQVVFFGAVDADSIDDYFNVHQNRHERVMREAIRQQYLNGSPAIHLLNGVEAYSDALGVDIMTAARLAITHLQTVLPSMKRRASTLVGAGMPDIEAAREVFRELAECLIPSHIEKARLLIASGRFVSSLINKPAFYADGADGNDTASPLRLTVDDARGIMAVYPLEKMPYSREELALGNAIIKDMRLQSALLLFQMAVVDYTKQYLVEHPERMQHRYRLLPFTEFFVVENGNDDPMTALVPNPKLLQVLSNNLVPAIAGIMLEEEVTLDTITDEQVARSAQEAKKRRVFHLQIGKFNNHDPLTDTVELELILNRTCPAMQTLTTGLERWLPKIFNLCREKVAR